MKGKFYRNNIKLWYISNTIALIVEVCVIVLSAYLISSNIIIAIIVASLWIILGVILYLSLSKLKKRKAFDDIELNYQNLNFDKECQEINKKVKKYLGYEVEFIYTDYELIPSAGAIGKRIVLVNKDFIEQKKNKQVSKGIVAHEVGHIMSGLIEHSYYGYIHFGGIFTTLFQIPMFMFYSGKKKTFPLAIIILILAIPLNITNYVSLYLYRKDEHYANLNSILLGGAEELRTYYYSCGSQSRLVSFSDMKHPNISDMLKQMDLSMNKRGLEKRVYLSNGDILYIDTRETELTKDQIAFKFYRYHRNETDVFAYQYGKCYLEGIGVDRDLKKALSIFKGIKTNQAKHMIGVCLEKLGDVDKALNVFLDNKENHASLVSAATILFDKEKYNEANELLVDVKAKEANILLKKIRDKIREQEKKEEGNEIAE